MFLRNAVASSHFSPQKMAKTTLFSGNRLFAGLNCFEPGQEHALHSHAGQDKLYVVLSGTAVVTVGDQEETLEPGGVAFAADGVPHAIRNPGPERLVVMAVLAPPPK